MATREQAREAARKAREARLAREAEEADSKKDAQRAAKQRADVLNDPGRPELILEWLAPMSKAPMLVLPLEWSDGHLEVHRLPSSSGLQSKPPPEANRDDLVQEWRVLRFNVAPLGLSNIAQAVVKLWVAPPGSPELPRPLHAAMLPFPYNRTMASVVISTLQALGAPVLRSADQEKEERLNILCIGLGGGSLPAFLSQFLPNCYVDAVELEAAVLQAAKEALGFETGPRLTVAIDDGPAFAERRARRIQGGASAYDAVIIDAMDDNGNVPWELLCEEGGDRFGRALAGGLLRDRGGLVAINLMPNHHPHRVCTDIKAKLACRHERLGSGFAITAQGTQNYVAVQTCGEAAVSKFGPDCMEPDMREALHKAARKVQSELGSPFDISRFAELHSLSSTSRMGMKMMRRAS